MDINELVEKAKYQVNKIQNPFDGMQFEVSIPQYDISPINGMATAQTNAVFDFNFPSDCIARFVYDSGKWRLISINEL